jgi:hypothetical protein
LTVRNASADFDVPDPGIEALLGCEET